MSGRDREEAAAAARRLLSRSVVAVLLAALTFAWVRAATPFEMERAHYGLLVWGGLAIWWLGAVKRWLLVKFRSAAPRARPASEKTEDR